MILEKKISTINLLKVFACFSIILIHFDFFVNIKLSNSYSYISVHFFIILSGFMYGLKNYKKFSFKENFLILKKKLFQIYPVHILILIIFFLIEVSKYYAPDILNIYPNYEPFNKNNFDSLVSNFFLLNAFVGNPLSFNGPSWFLSALIYSYLFFFLILGLFKSLNYFVLVIFIISYSDLYNDNYYLNYGPYCISNFIFAMSTGYLSSIYLNRKKNFYFFIEISLLVIFCAYLFYKENYLSIQTIIIAVILYILVFFNDSFIIKKKFVNDLINYFGNITFSMYMTHSLIFWLFSQILRFICKVNFVKEESVFKIDLSFGLSVLTVFVLLFLTIFVSIYCNRYFEKNFYEFLKKNSLIK